MCNRYRMTAKQAEMAAAMGVQLPFDEHPNLPPPELFPKRPAWVVRNTDQGRAFDVMTRGFPRQMSNAKGKLVDKPVTNVRNLFSTFWRTALTSPARRTLIPVTEFSEYGPGVTGRLPLHWFSVPSRSVFAFAGIWRPLTEQCRAYAFLTCEPNPLVAPFHPKAMPVILHEDDYERWLTCSYDEACALATPYPSQLMSVESPPEPSTAATI